ncbi:MAG: type II toxin-antitoxin system RelE/ParE family toxin [Pyrinomonadaceae bacterium]|nr:type II toxin-antitoxin system RelE/ParE family toxin [Pyrinomonadaceae bacterium]
MIFIETTAFTRRLQTLLTDDEYSRLQSSLVVRPDLGDVITGSGGIRKLRWQSSGRGKRGGARVIYYWAITRDTILMLGVYSKNEKADLTPDEIKIMKRVVEVEFR